MIGNEGTGGTRLYCRWFAVGWCFEHANGRCRGWQAMKPWRWGCDSNLISPCVIRHARLKHIVSTERSRSQLHLVASIILHYQFPTLLPFCLVFEAKVNAYIQYARVSDIRYRRIVSSLQVLHIQASRMATAVGSNHQVDYCGKDPKLLFVRSFHS